MKAVLVVAVLAMLAAHVAAECANMCSGHGVCGTTDMCRCYRNWRGADCSERTCQFARSFVDTAQGDLNHDGNVDFATNDPDFNGYIAGQTPATNYVAESTWAIDSPTNNLNDFRFVTVRTQWKKSTFELFPHSTKHRALNHVYMECSNKGSCDRTTGECQCYDGYEGSACQRSVCPNACNGHGVCRSIMDLTQTATSTVEGNYTYQLWDGNKIQACLCDPGYSGVDCSERLCPKGDDPLTPSDGSGDDHVFTLTCTKSDSGATGTAAPGSVRLQFTDAYGEEWTSTAISGFETASTSDPGVATALLGIPNSVIPSVTVTSTGAATTQVISITMTGNPGDLAGKMDATQGTSTDSAVSWAVATSTSGTKTNTECSSRGLCDYETGICKCFRGYRLADCSGQSALAF